jgi:hypothetical protein
MKRSLLAVAAVLALASASAYSQTPGFPQPSFKDYTDSAPTPITGTTTSDHRFPKGSMNGGGGPTGPATVIVDGNDRSFAERHAATTGATRSDAGKDDSRPYPTLNDTFHYPSY